MRKIEDIWPRALKTFLQAFFGVLIPEVVALLNGAQLPEGNWWVAVVLPIICASLASGISAGWNTIQNYFAGKVEEDEHDFTDRNN